MKTYTQEFNDRAQHRLVCSDGRATCFAPYTQWTYMDGNVGVTDFYMPGATIMPAAEFCEKFGVTAIEEV